MKLLAEISDATLGIREGEKLDTKYIFRKSARVILFNDMGEIALQHLQVPQYYKLPGGGVEQDEPPEEAAKREVREEVGCYSNILENVGITVEYRNDENLIHLSYCYTAKVVGEMEAPHYEQGEIDEGQGTVWISPKQAIELVRSGKPTTYNGKFIVVRELAFLNEVFKNL